MLLFSYEKKKFLQVVKYVSVMFFSFLAPFMKLVYLFRLKSQHILVQINTLNFKQDFKMKFLVFFFVTFFTISIVKSDDGSYISCRNRQKMDLCFIHFVSELNDCIHHQRHGCYKETCFDPKWVVFRVYCM